MQSRQWHKETREKIEKQSFHFCRLFAKPDAPVPVNEEEKKYFCRFMNSTKKYRPLQTDIPELDGAFSSQDT